ncbi:hypothetical protein CC85DRAFT_288054 [Cutaneotrichosporon oleaginosum]|uniref:Secreted protein n=1 Tax=Cutaneotrichosporon oleaginosum TaxID=879819 RepID=A0A0J0XFM5_9TREE|nr:uncharacterized protein CC85DRAFT_288054 [Cutaneotrichosporon oleaginosum]KLT39877.1 hypothetical protein CC85DRAFT_288054 [Cutaneotrichosporon oleaginosum]TXT14197.1 hypothetical protein COLE_00390 [Cutaneotrichosporon oleaginosum]
MQLTMSVAAIIYCLLSTCLGQQVRRSDVWGAICHDRIAHAPHISHRQRSQHSYHDGNGLVWDYNHHSPMESIEMLSPPSSNYGL